MSPIWKDTLPSGADAASKGGCTECRLNQAENMRVLKQMPIQCSRNHREMLRLTAGWGSKRYVCITQEMGQRVWSCTTFAQKVYKVYKNRRKLQRQVCKCARSHTGSTLQLCCSYFACTFVHTDQVSHFVNNFLPKFVVTYGFWCLERQENHWEAQYMEQHGEPRGTKQTSKKEA